MKPYIISHMMTSVDGRIDSPMEGNPIGHTSVYVAKQSDEYTIIVGYPRKTALAVERSRRPFSMEYPIRNAPCTN